MDHLKKYWKRYATTLTFVALIMLGFNNTHGKIMGCYAESTVFVKAEYSEVTTSVCTDANGNVSTCTSTNSWSKPASPIWYNETINGQLSQTSMPENVQSEIFQTNIGIYTTDFPPHDKTMSNHSDFDYFSFRKDITHTVSLQEPDTISEVSKNINFYPDCLRLKDAGFSLKVKTWYTISYDVEEFSE